jgi:hypothetical protein
LTISTHDLTDEDLSYVLTRLTRLFEKREAWPYLGLQYRLRSNPCSFSRYPAWNAGSAPYPENGGRGAPRPRGQAITPSRSAWTCAQC